MADRGEPLRQPTFCSSFLPSPDLWRLASPDTSWANAVHVVYVPYHASVERSSERQRAAPSSVRRAYSITWGHSLVLPPSSLSHPPTRSKVLLVEEEARHIGHLLAGQLGRVELCAHGGELLADSGRST